MTAPATRRPRRPYLLRAMHEWITDSGLTPHLVVDAEAPGVQVPRAFVREGRIILNCSWTATHALRLGNEEVTFGARFGGVAHSVVLPIAAVLGIYANESGEGIVFTPEDLAGSAPEEPPPTPAPSEGAADRRARFKVVK
ncbi:MAG: ClpXP protease specificity-enhancing factor [Gammaproteobacteria bacterium]